MGLLCILVSSLGTSMAPTFHAILAAIGVENARTNAIMKTSKYSTYVTDLLDPFRIFSVDMPASFKPIAKGSDTPFVYDHLIGVDNHF